MVRGIFQDRIASLRRLIADNKANGLLLSRCENFAWLTFGGRSHITLRETEGVASIFITEERVQLFANNIELGRLYQEEIPEEIGDLLEPFEYGWQEGERSFLLPYLTDKKILSDTGRYGTIPIDIRKFRLVLSEPEQENYRRLGRIVDRVLNGVVKELTPDLTEVEVQGRVFHELMAENTEPILALVFSEGSALRYRHNLPRQINLGRKVFVSVCARQKGLVVSSTRSLFFGDHQAFAEQHRKNCYVDGVAIAFSRPGNSLDEVFEHLQNSYAEMGFSGEWKKHHQGGLAGYLSREIVAKRDYDYVINAGNAVAWNPTIAGTKSEDTVVVKEHENEIVSYPTDSEWPGLEFVINGQTIRRPDILVK